MSPLSAWTARTSTRDDISGRITASYEPVPAVGSTKDPKMHVLGPVRMQQNDPNSHASAYL